MGVRYMIYIESVESSYTDIYQSPKCLLFVYILFQSVWMWYPFNRAIWIAMGNIHKILARIYLLFLDNDIQSLEKDTKMADVLKPAWQSRKAWPTTAQNNREQKRGYSFLSDFKYFLNCWRAPYNIKGHKWASAAWYL